MSVTVYGRSDDLIELRGDVEEEFSLRHDDEPTYLAFSDGTLLSIQYAPGNEAFWRIHPIRYGTAKYSKVEATDEQEEYSDQVTLDGEIKWVLYGDQYTIVQPKETK